MISSHFLEPSLGTKGRRSGTFNHGIRNITGSRIAAYIPELGGGAIRNRWVLPSLWSGARAGLRSDLGSCLEIMAGFEFQGSTVITEHMYDPKYSRYADYQKGV